MELYMSNTLQFTKVSTSLIQQQNNKKWIVQSLVVFKTCLLKVQVDRLINSTKATDKRDKCTECVFFVVLILQF